MALSEGKTLQVEKIGKCKHPHLEACLTCPKKSKEVMEAEGEKKSVGGVENREVSVEGEIQVGP